MKKAFSINVITGQGGGGHYATYHAIRAMAEKRHFPWEFHVTDVDDIITELSGKNQVKNAYDMFGFSAHDLYNKMVKSGWTWLWPLLMRLNKLLVKLNYEMGVRIFEQRCREQQPDLVISVMPLFNKVVWESVQNVKPDTPVVTILTDFADCPPDFWIEPDIGNYVVCGTEKAVEQARSLGVPKQQIIKTSGLVVHPNFYEPVLGDCTTNEESARCRERERLGLNADLPTGLVMFGGNGAQVMLDIAKRLEKFHENLQLIFLCGRNEDLATALRQRESSQKRFVTTFTEEIPYYMSLSDFFIGKPGNVSVSEAIVMKLPVITECNRFTMSQERYCAEWIEDNKVGIVIPDFRKVDQAVATLIQPHNYAHYRANLAIVSNQAVFEVIALLQRLLQQADSSAALPETSENLL
ncbi:MAG: glycosyltransferase [Kovacikia sp.]